MCPNRDWFSSFEKLDRYFGVMADDHPCHMEGICTVLVKMFDGMVRELKDVRYVPQLKRNLISVGALKALGLEVSISDDVLKMIEARTYMRKVFASSDKVRFNERCQYLQIEIL